MVTQLDTTGLNGDIVIDGVRYPVARALDNPNKLLFGKVGHDEDEPGAHGRVVKYTWNNFSDGMGEFTEDPEVEGYAYAVGYDCTVKGIARFPQRRLTNTDASVKAVGGRPLWYFEEVNPANTTSIFVYILQAANLFKYRIADGATSFNLVYQKTFSGSALMGRPAEFEGAWYLALGASVDFRELTRVNARMTHCFTYDGTAFTDRLAEAESVAGVAFTLLADTNDFVYFGCNSPNDDNGEFNALQFDLDTAGVGITSVWEYWNGTTWAALTVTDGTTNFTADGDVTWTIPADWASTSINAVNARWVRVRTSSGPTTNPTCLSCPIIDQFTTAGGSMRALAFSTIQDGATARLGRGYSTNLVALAATVPTTAGNWGSGFEVGDTSAAITDMREGGDSLWVAKEDGLYVFDSVGASYKVPFSPATIDAQNGQGMLALFGLDFVFYPSRSGLALIAGGVITEVGHDSLGTLYGIPNITNEPVRGRWRELALGNDDWIYGLYRVSSASAGWSIEIDVAQGGSTSERSFIMAGDMRRGLASIIWHTYDYEDGLARGLFVDSRKRLWTVNDNGTANQFLVVARQLSFEGSPDAGRHSLGYGNPSRTYSLFLPALKFGVLTQLLRVEVEAYGQSADSPIQVYAYRDRGAGATVGSTITGDGISKRYWTAGTADTAFELRLELRTVTTAGYSSTSDATDPQIHSVTVVVLPRPDTADLYQWTIDTRRKFSNDDVPLTMRNNLDALKGGASVIVEVPSAMGSSTSTSFTMNIVQVVDEALFTENGEQHFLIQVTARERVTA